MTSNPIRDDTEPTPTKYSLWEISISRHDHRITKISKSDWEADLLMLQENSRHCSHGNSFNCRYSEHI